MTPVNYQEKGKRILREPGHGESLLNPVVGDQKGYMNKTLS